MPNKCDSLEHPSNINWEDAMKRDLDFIRTILLKVEEVGNPGLTGHQIESLFQGNSIEEISYHLELLRESRLINGERVINSSNIHWIIYGLTWDGHEFLDAARNNSIWEKAKDIFVHSGGSLTLNALLQILFDLVRQQVGLK